MHPAKAARTIDLSTMFALIQLSGPSGNEQTVRAYIRKAMEKYVDEIFTDKFGNLVCRKKGKGKVAMLVGHMDEVGLMVRKIDKNGFISCSSVGWIEPITLLGERVILDGKRGPIPGVISNKEIMNDEEIKNPPKMDDVIVDTGLTKQELHAQDVIPGTYIHMLLHTSLMANGRLISGKALDDRLGCFILMEVAKRLKNVEHNIDFVFTVQEEVGLFGAKTSIYDLNPEWVIVVDTTNTDDAGENPSIELGHGPCIMVKDAEMISNRCLNDWLFTLCKQKKIPYQIDVNELGTTDALTISVSKGGIPTTVVGVAVRNIHTTVGIASVKDIEHAIDMLTALLKKEPRTCTT
jgi:endoglucanase